MSKQNGKANGVLDELTPNHKPLDGQRSLPIDQPQFTIDPEFRSLVPALRPDELEGLRASIILEGCRDPLVVWGSQNILVDGHNRFGICQAEAIPFKTVNLEFIDRDAAKLWIKENQLSRRNLTDDQRSAIAFQISEQRSKIEMQRRAVKARASVQSRNPVKNPDLEDTVSSKSVEPPKKRTRAAVAKEAKVPERKVRDLAVAAKIVERTKGKPAAQQLVKDVEDGKKTVSQVRAQARKIIKETAPPTPVEPPDPYRFVQSICDDVLALIASVNAPDNEEQRGWGGFESVWARLSPRQREGVRGYIVALIESLNEWNLITGGQIDGN